MNRRQYSVLFDIMLIPFVLLQIFLVPAIPIDVALCITHGTWIAIPSHRDESCV